jgi:hypothetical protein
MHELVGKAREEDEQFWSEMGFFAEAPSDDEYQASENGEDVVDSDFDRPEDEEEENEEEDIKIKDRDKKKTIRDRPIIKRHKVPKEVDEADKNQNGEEDISGPSKKIKRLAAEVPLPMEKVNCLLEYFVEICGGQREDNCKNKRSS